jgi:hypothetical protein
MIPAMRTPPGSWGVLWLFLIPFGGGIPSGVLFGQSHGVGWPLLEVLYFVSDVILACLFEPAMILFLRAARRRPRLAHATEAMRVAVLRTTELYGTTGGPFTLILIAFGLDPMTGRAAAAAAGHGFVAGWTFAIAGDMIYFTFIMASTLWLNSILGDGRVTTAAILVLMFVAPLLIRRWKERRAKYAASSRRP